MGKVALFFPVFQVSNKANASWIVLFSIMALQSVDKYSESEFSSEIVMAVLLRKLISLAKCCNFSAFNSEGMASTWASVFLRYFIFLGSEKNDSKFRNSAPQRMSKYRKVLS